MSSQEARLARMEALSDGVFSVALTLLLLEIRPKSGEIGSDAWWHQILLNWGLFAASFALVGIYWVAHKNECRYLTASDRFVDWLNLVFLATVALLPFSMSVLAESRSPQTAVAKAVNLYLGNVASAGLALSFLFGYIVVQGWLDQKGKEKWRFTVSKNAVVPLLCFIVWLCFELWPQFVLSHLVSFMAGPPAIYLGFTICVALYLLFTRWLRSRKK